MMHSRTGFTDIRRYIFLSVSISPDTDAQRTLGGTKPSRREDSKEALQS